MSNGYSTWTTSEIERHIGLQFHFKSMTDDVREISANGKEYNQLIMICIKSLTIYWLFPFQSKIKK
ncbi:hypothetical protein O9Z69_00100 [Pediococcus pentosaceus]|uniref:hypothetical protein n=1 Tax=Pediococcus pentosaceus TaxID=1255 RepID=UPI0013638B42|nr:hypothetical protein [Pediococcus pentosaceus]WFC00954.1 hypothetical protein O9Z69_00100 [Pediococcus pentosaceus]